MIDTFSLKTNYTNFIKLKEDHIEEDNYLITEKYLTIPIYISENKGHISLEHTNLVASNILSNDRIEKSSNFKKKINEIITEKILIKTFPIKIKILLNYIHKISNQKYHQSSTGYVFIGEQIIICYQI